MKKNIYFVLGPLGIGIAALCNLFINAITIPELGDGKLIALILASHELFPAAKYLAGIETLRVLHAAIWQFPPLESMLPERIESHAGFLRVMGVVIMAVTTIFLLRAYPYKYRVILVATTPIWWLFSLGYLEYYPFVAGIFLMLLCWLFQGNLEEKPEVAVGLVCGALPLVYLGFAPFCLIVLAIYLWGEKGRKIGKTLTAAILGFLFVLRLFWSKSLSQYFVSLYQDLNFGEKNTIYEGYKGYAASNTSIFFKSEYVFSGQHFTETLHMLLLGLGVAPLFLLFYALSTNLREIGRLSRKMVLAMTLLGWSIFYLIFTIPKLGPVRDVDMFFLTYIIIAFMVGAGLESNARLKPTVILPLWILSSAYSFSKLLALSV